jgi:magnesium-transporting ATPase (P-type)
MLWINIVMDTLAGLAYGGEKPRQSYMAESPKRRGEPIINQYMWGQILFASIFIGAVSMWFLMSRGIQNGFAGRGAGYAMTAFFAFFMFINIFNSFNSRTHDINLISYLSLNKPFVWIMGLVMVVQVLLVFFGGAIFRTVPLEMKHFALVLVLAATVIPIDMLRKLFIRWRFGDGVINT